MTNKEEQIFTSVESTVKKVKELAQSLSYEIPTYKGRDPRAYYSTIDEEYAAYLQDLVNGGEIERFAVSAYANAGIIVVKFPNIATKLRYVVELKGDSWWE